MNDIKIRAGFLYFFFFFQGVFLTGMILLAVFDNKIIPVIKEKDMEIELLLNEMNKIKKNHKHLYKWDNEKVNFGSFAI